MALNKKHCLLFLVILFILLLGVNMTSATDVNLNDTQGIMDNDRLSTPQNYDVDNMVHSDVSNANTDAKVENYNITSDNTDNTKTNRHSENLKTINNDITSNNKINLKSDGEGSFTQLQELIVENSVIELNQNYQFISGTDDGLSDGIVINKNIVIFGNGFTIDAKNSARIFKISGTDINVELININLINANSTLADNDGNGGAIYTDSHLTIADCTFTNNAANNGGAVFVTKQSDAEYVDSLNINNCIFTDNVALVNGGAINIFENSINTKILNSNFTNNRVIGYNNSDNTRWYGDGGAICFNKSSTDTLIDNSIFINNSVNANGGAVMWHGSYGNITSCKFINNSAPYAAGALRLDGSHTIINNSLFEGNYDPVGNYSWGSALYLTGDYCNITYSNFTNNTGANHGGAIAIDGSNDYLDFVNFNNNTAYIGGAVFITKNENVTFNNTSFENNIANYTGGAININDYANYTKVLNSNFTNNKVIGFNNSDNSRWYGNGSAINFGEHCSYGLIDNSIFTNNSANANGGAVMWNGNYGNITSSKFYNNTSPYAGGAVRLRGNNLFINDSLFDGNYDPRSYNSWGSAVYVSGHNCNITYSNFTNNVKANRGGAVYLEGDNAVMEYNNLHNNTAKDGGAIYISGTNSTIEYNNFTHNNATTSGGAIYSKGNNATIKESNFEFNHANGAGGSLRLESSSYSNIIECNFTNETCGSTGGSLSCYNIKYLNLLDSNFINCSNGLNKHGGAIHFQSNSDLKVNNCTFINDTAYKDAGAIYFDNANGKNSVLSNSTFINCISLTKSAGAVCWKDNNGLIINNLFINCSSYNPGSGWGDGGAMYFEKASNNLLINDTYINCSGVLGGAISYRSGNPNSVNNTHINCTFINNNAYEAGGAVSFTSANSTFDNCVFINNTAPNGGSIYYSVNNGIIIINSMFANTTTNVTNGGFIYLNGSKINITNTTFYNGSATNAGALYIESVSNYEISNNTFDYNNATNGGAVYINGPITLTESTFTNNTAENGGALYINKDTTIDGCNITNNNATTGSGIYLKAGTLNLKNSRLLDNQAHIDSLNLEEEVIGNQKYIRGFFTGLDNYLNGIYCIEENVYCVNVWYLGINGIVNTDDTSSTIHYSINEAYQLVILDIYDRNNNLESMTNYTDENGKFEFVVSSSDDYGFKLYHPEDSYYTYILYTFNKNLVTLTVNVTNISYGESETIKVNVTSDNGIPTGRILVELNSTLDGFTNKTFEADLDENGTATITESPLDLLNVSEYDVYVKYLGDSSYFSENTTTKFTVIKVEPTIFVDTEDINYGENETVTVNITNNNAKGNITVKVINSNGDVLDTLEFNLNSTELLKFNITELEPDDYTLNISYINDTNYNDTNVTAEFKVKKQVITINQLSDIYVDENQIIAGVVIDGFGRVVTEGTVNITLSNGTVIPCQLDDSGMYLINPKFINNGTYIANASYIYNDKIRSISVNREFVVSKIPTITNVTVVNNKVDNVTIDVVVRENTTDSKYIIENGTINVTVNGVSKEYNITGATTRIVLNETVNITTTNELDFTVEYVENWKYLNSTGINSTNGERIENIQAVPKNSTITVTVTDDPSSIGDIVKITGQVFDEYGNVITEGTVKVYINTDSEGISVEITEFEDEFIYSLPYETLIAGINNVSVEYSGNSAISSSENNTTFTVEEIPTITNVTVTNHTVGNVTLNISVQDMNGNIIKDGKVNITIAGNTPIEVKLSGEDYTVVYLLENMTSVGNISVTVEYTGNETYMPSVANNTDDNNVLKNITVIPRNATITVDVTPSSTDIGGNVTISGQLVDEMGNYISNANLVVIVDGVAIAAKTNSTGDYSINYTTTRIADDIIVNATFDGGNNYNPAWNNTTFNVTKIATKTNVTIVNSTIGNVVIHVIATNLTNDPVERGHVVVRNQTGQIIGEGELVNGGVDITLNVNTVGNVKVNVTYQENDIYYGSNATNSSLSDDDPEINITNIDVVKQEANITIGLNPETLIVGENVYIQGIVTVGDVIITNGQVNVTVNGTNTTVDINSDGSYNLTFTATNAGEYTVNATYLGNENISSITSSNIEFTVNKMPSNTTVTIINNTIGHVAIEVSVTNSTGSPITGKINVTFANGTIIEEELDIDGKVNVTIPSNSIDTLEVNVTYLENDNYYSSVAINTTSGVSPDKVNTTVIDINKLNSSITVDLNTTNLLIGESVDIIVNITDEDGNQITDIDDVIIYIDGVEIVNRKDMKVVDGKIIVSNQTVSSGTFTVTATYKGNSTVNGSDSNSMEYTVGKIPTTVTISPITDVEVNKEFTIEVTLTNTTGDSISGKAIVITVNDVALTNIPETDSDGKTSVTFTPRDNTDLVIKAVYLSSQDEVYLGNETQTTVKVDMSQSDLRVKVNKTDLYVGESVNISGSLKDGQGNKIVDAAVTIYVNGKSVITTFTDENGNYSHVINHLSAGEYTVQAVYDGVPNAIIGDSDTTSYTVHKMPTDVEITLPDQVEVFVPFDIEVRLTNNTGNTNPIEGKSISITVNGEVITTVPLTDDEGKTVVSYTPQNNSTIVVKAVFDEDDSYLGNNDEKTIVSENILISKSNITVEVNESSLYVDESVEISGKLIDGQGRPIPTADVKVYIDDVLKTTVETNRNGEYSYVVGNLNKGNYNVKVVYDGSDDIISPCDNTTSYLVSLIPTKTEVSVINNTVGNVTIDIIVTENLTGRHTNIISAGAIEVTVNGQTSQYPVKGRNTTITLDGNAFINTTDEVTFNVKYIENDKYLSSNGLNSSTGEEITKFNADSQQSTVTVTVTPESQTSKKKVTITGHVYNGMGNEITSGNVYLSINDETPIEVSLSDAGYSHEYTTDIVGINNVTVEFKDVLTENLNVLIKSSTNNTTFTVDKIETTTTVEVLNNTAGNVTIDIIVTGKDENNTMTGTVNVKVNGQTIPVELTGTGNKTVKLDIKDSGINYVTVEFTGNDKYLPSIGNDTQTNEELTNITVDKQTVHITVNVNPEGVYVDENVTITGTLTNDFDEKLINTDIILTIDGVNYTVTTDDNGEYEYVYNGTRVGEIKVNATFKANATYTEVSSNTSFNVTKLPTNTTVTIINSTIGNVTVSVDVTDVYEHPVVNGTVVVYDKDHENILTNASVINGKTGEFNIPADSVGDLEVIVEYMEDIKYLASNAANNTQSHGDNITYINVTKQDAAISINIVKDNVTIGETVVIYGTVTDGTGKLIPTGNITILINGTEHDTTVTNGEYRLDNITIEYGVFDVNATFKGNANVSEVTSNTVNFTVNKITTITLVSIVNTTAGNVSIDVIVKDNRGNVVTTGKLNITTEDGTFTVDISGQKTNIPLNYNTNGTKKVSVEYIENDVYLNSTGLDKVSYDVDPENAEIFNNITVTRQNTTITVTTISPVKVGNSTIISGKLIDEQSRPINGAEVVVRINNTDYIVTTNNNGEYSLKYNDTVVGTHNVTSIYNGNETFIGSNDTTNFEVEKRDTKISIDTIEDVPVGKDVTIIGKLEDKFGIPIKETEINVTFDGNTHIVQTDDEGNFNESFPTDSIGTKTVKVEYAGNENYNSADKDTTMNVVPNNGTLSLELPTDALVDEPTSINSTLTNQNGEVVPDTPVNVTVNGKVYSTTTDENGKFTVSVDNVIEGTNNVIVSAGNENITVKDTEDTFNAVKQDSIITINPISDAKVGDNVTITGKLTDEQGNPINNAVVTIIVNGEEYNATTDENGNYELIVSNVKEGLNNVTASYESAKYSPSTAKGNFTVTKKNVTLTVDSVTGVVGEKITLVAHVTDEFGNPVNGGNLVFKLNGITLKSDGNFNKETTTVMKFNVVDGIVTYTMTAEAYLNGGKNITATYSGSSKYESAKGNVADVNIKKRTAQIEVTVVPTTAKQNTDIVFTATLTDTTENGTNTTCLTTDGYVLFKVNGVSMKDEEGNPDWIPVTHSVVNYVYHVPTGTAGNGNTSKEYEVEAIYNNSIFLEVKNTTVFNVDKSIVNINFIETTVKDNVLSVKATLTDYEDKNLVGDNKVCVKINGKTYQENGKTKYFTVSNGNIDLTDIQVSTTNIKSVTLVTGEREAYQGASATTTNITILTKKNVTLTVDLINGNIGEKITLVAHVTDEFGNPVNGGNLVFKLNGITLKSDGNFNKETTTVMKFNVVDGIVTYTMTAEAYLNGGKNITATYSGSSIYESAKGNVADVNIKKRTAQIEVTVVPTTAKQNTDIVFTATLTDTTENGTNTTCLTTDGYVLFKVNGVSMKDEEGNPDWIPVTHSVVNYVYHIPTGTAGNGNTSKECEIEAIYNNSIFLEVKNTTVFNVDKSIVNINFIETTVKNDILSIKATLTDYENKNLVGNSKVCVKINGKTYQENGKTKYFTVSNGNIDLTDIQVSTTNVKSVTLVTGETSSYQGARATTTDISTS